MIKFKSLNRRLLFAFACLTIVVCLFFIRLSSVLVDISEQNAYEAMLHAHVDALRIGEPFLTKSQDIHSNAYVSVFEAPPIDFRELEDALKQATSGKFTTANNELYIYQQTQDANGRTFVVTMNISALKTNNIIAGFQSLVFSIVSISAILLCLLSSWYLAKWLSMPITRLTNDITEKGPTTPIFGLNREDEIGMLASALDQSYKEIQILLTREQNFTRDVSHELRTPITLIKNTIALNPSEILPVEATKIVAQASKELEQTVEVLLALARQENLQFQSHAILPIIEKTVLNIYNSYPQWTFDVAINIDSKYKVVGNQYLISLLCQNLVNNGFYHSNSGGMQIYTKSGSLIFENQIAGATQRPDYQGMGHGQYLVNRIAEEMQWALTIEQSEHYYRVIITTI